MQRVYLLLRNNQQFGPFTIAELLQQQLNSRDMLWVEGRSTAWTYLSEMELRVPSEIGGTGSGETEKNPNHTDEIEMKAEALRQKILSAAPSATYQARRFNNAENSKTAQNFSIATNDEEGPVIHFHDRRKEKKLIRTELAMSCLIIALFGAVFYGGKSIFDQKKTSKDEEVVTAISSEENTAKKIESSVPQNTTALKTEATIIGDSVIAIKKMPPIKKRIVTKPPMHIQKIEASVLPVPDKIETPPVQNTGKAMQQEIIAEEKPVTEIKEETTKKKSLGQAIRGLFHKKKKE